jgi:NADH dehydrogenase/NADH:ubiquinone oxidoreductase subunit G
MFSPSRVLKGVINFGQNRFTTSLTWKTLIHEIINTLYFQDHLNNHLNRRNKLIVVFNNTISLEVLNLLYVLSQKYSFIELRKFEGKSIKNDLENDFLLHTNPHLKSELAKSNLCMLIGMFSRYEGVNFNLNLRNRYLKGNFKVLCLGSSKNLTFPATSIGSNTKLLSNIVEGNNRICQEFISLQNPIISISSLNSKRKDYVNLFSLLEKLKIILKKYHNNWDNITVLNNSLNEVGLNYLNNFKPISEMDLKNNSGLYFINTDLSSVNFKKLIQIKLLNYLNKNLTWPYYSIVQNFNTNNENIDMINKSQKTFNNINLPAGSFFESSGTFINTEGSVKKSIKLISTSSQTKEDWQIIRKLTSNMSKLKFLTEKTNNKIVMNLNNFNKFKLLNNYLYYSNSSTTSNSHLNVITNSIKKKSNKIIFNYKSPKKKYFQLNL